MLDGTILVAVITALAAIIAPVVTSVINARTSLKLKRLEILETDLNVCISDFAKHYSELTNQRGYMEPYWNFVTASYRAIAQIHDTSIQADILSLLNYFRENNGSVDESTDQKFDAIMISVSKYLSKLPR